jgi:hypothetical protein
MASSQDGAVNEGIQHDGFPRKLIQEGQDPIQVGQAYTRAMSIATEDETIAYIAIANKNMLAPTHDCAVVTNKRLLIYKKKILGGVDLDDCAWRDVRDVAITEERHGVSLSIDTIQGWPLSIEGLPKAQAWRLHEFVKQHSDKLQDKVSAPSSDFGAETPASRPTNPHSSAPLPEPLRELDDATLPAEPPTPLISLAALDATPNDKHEVQQMHEVEEAHSTGEQATTNLPTGVPGHHCPP